MSSPGRIYLLSPANCSGLRARMLMRPQACFELAMQLRSIATKKYVDVLLPILGARLHFPAEFVGRGDMSRGGLMLRRAESGEHLTYLPVEGAVRHGTRPPKLV